MFRTQGARPFLLLAVVELRLSEGPGEKGQIGPTGSTGSSCGEGVASLALPSNELTTPLIDSWPDPNSCHPLLTFGWASSKLTTVRDTVDTCPVFT